MTKRGQFAAGFAGCLSAATQAQALDIFPADYTVLPSGTNLFLAYGQYSTAGSLNVDGVGDVPNSELGVGLGIARYLHYNDIGGIPIAVQAFLPFGGFTEARIGGGEPPTKDGLGDLTFGFTVFPVHSAEPTGTTIGVTAYLVTPTGAFSDNPSAINLGSGSWSFMPQVGLIQGLGNGFFVDAAFDVNWRADHTENGIEFSRDASAQFQAYLRYQFSPTTSVSVGYSGTFGGENFVNDTYTGIKTRNDQIRLHASTFLTPTLQLGGMIGTDVNAEGGFEQDFVGTIRLLKLF
ncbi:Uncharacterized conserved protein [Mesorhizobium albiziae]|uniref:Uncharacterized conserved protein n=1 Tax=Neomesorhizobium albiziae TaxID=335020 RepID=A0A1I3XNV4_9HYPH|nr:transporter [Mesorhizobium albiziae]GLS30321.1 peptidase [Mesorhizobium albiziae]SFK20676.1 Uncharacterized conserved protein [Mesorhizobium albiziae]